MKNVVFEYDLKEWEGFCFLAVGGEGRFYISRE